MNYVTWASNLKLKLESQGYLDHPTQKVTDITPSDLHGLCDLGVKP